MMNVEGESSVQPSLWMAVYLNVEEWDEPKAFL
jgi:hypothetical protein